MHALDESIVVDCKIYDEVLNIFATTINDIKKSVINTNQEYFRLHYAYNAFFLTDVYLYPFANPIIVYSPKNHIKANFKTDLDNIQCQWSCDNKCSESIGSSISDTGSNCDIKQTFEFCHNLVKQQGCVLDLNSFDKFNNINKHAYLLLSVSVSWPINHQLMKSKLYTSIKSIINSPQQFHTFIYRPKNYQKTCNFEFDLIIDHQLKKQYILYQVIHGSSPILTKLITEANQSGMFKILTNIVQWDSHLISCEVTQIINGIEILYDYGRQVQYIFNNLLKKDYPIVKNCIIKYYNTSISFSQIYFYCDAIIADYTQVNYKLNNIDLNIPYEDTLPIIIPIINFENEKYIYIEVNLCHTFKLICSLTKQKIWAKKTDETFIWNTISQCSKSIFDSNLPQEIIYAILSTYLVNHRFRKNIKKEEIEIIKSCLRVALSIFRFEIAEKMNIMILHRKIILYFCRKNVTETPIMIGLT
ncbi:hypothetical protein A3Q56_00854 [Intoshia linei]|uniref:Uncharacterized protein n=1 Tax=Intoshia linei TaxID=1819745 RepID=A0A177BCY1_9BILA|nr:hypothetical protein A3Q56_00854 [Intoshia linei]